MTLYPVILCMQSYACMLLPQCALKSEINSAYSYSMEQWIKSFNIWFSCSSGAWCSVVASSFQNENIL